MREDTTSWLVVDTATDTTHTRAGGRGAPQAVGIMRVYGEVDLTTRTAFEAGLGEVLARDPHRIVLDCSGMAFCSAAGLGALMRTVADCTERGTDIAVVGVSPLLLRLCAQLWPGPQPLPYRNVTDAVTAVAVSPALPG